MLIYSIFQFSDNVFYTYINKLQFLTWLFSEKTWGIAIALASASSLWCNTVTFCNFSVITEDIYFKLGICVQYPKSNPYYQGRHFLFQNYAPFFNLKFLSSIKHRTATPWLSHAVLLLNYITFILQSAIAFNFDQSKILVFGIELI